MNRSENSKKNILLMSLPRSGSTWFAERMKAIYDLKYFDELFRTSFGDPKNPLYHSNILNDMSLSEEFYKNLDPISLAKIKSISALNNESDILIKETTNLFQIPFLKALLPKFEIIFLQRSVGGVINSLLKVKDVGEKWSLNDRSKILRENINQILNQEYNTDNTLAQSCINQYLWRMEEYRNIFDRADKTKFKGSFENSRILAYLAAQSLEAKANILHVHHYENMALNGIPKNLLHNRSPIIKDCSNPESKDKNANYLTHSTKNPSSPNAWVNNYTDEDWESVLKILDGTASSVFPYLENPEIILSQIVKMSFIKTPKGFLSNRPVISEEFEIFLNQCFEIIGPEFYEKLGFKPSSTHNFSKLGKKYESLHPDKPITHISPLAALAYSIYNGHCLPSIEVYTKLQENYQSFSINRENANFGDYGRLKRISDTPQVDDFYDLFGNISEIVIDENGNFFKAGGSYKDEINNLSLSKQNRMLWFQRDTETGFRMGKDIRGKEETDLQEQVIKIIQKNACPNIIHKELLKLGTDS